MRLTHSIAAAAAALTTTALLAAGALAATSHPGSMHGMDMGGTTKAMTAADLRVTLDNLFGEHAVLAMNATNAGVDRLEELPRRGEGARRRTRSRSRRRSARSTAPKAADTFLDGRFMWRDHIRFFVAYTGALAKKDRAGQAKAVKNLQQYTKTFGTFLSTATGLPQLAVQNDLLGHVLELKGQLDAYAAGNYARAASQYHGAYNHMFMTGDLVAGAIAKQKHLG